MKLSGKTRAEVRPFSYSAESLRDFLQAIENEDEETQKLLLNYPTVYVVYHRSKDSYRVYVGETNDIAQRTKTHLTSDPRLVDLRQEDIDKVLLLPENFDAKLVQSAKWKAFRDNDSTILVIGHTLFNKSMTLDIEDRLMLFLSSVDDVESAGANSVKINNSRRNVQTEYFTQEFVNQAFQEIWRKLRDHDPELFPLERMIRESALFKASPFHQLNEQQVGAKVQILDAVDNALTVDEFDRDQEESQLILVKGGAGTGKTVLLSSVFYDLFQARESDDSLGETDDFEAYLLVNHDEQVTVYTQIAEKLGLGNKKNPRVMKPTKFINDRQDSGKIADVVLIDEAHLLWTQGKQSYRGENQLVDILGLARVVIAVFDPMQVLAGNQYWQDEDLEALEIRAGDGNIIELSEQMRIDSDGPAEDWITEFVQNGTINPIPTNDKYKIEVFNSPQELHAKIQKKSDPSEESEVEKGLSRLIATYDWRFSSGKTRPEDSDTWDVTIDSFRLPWNNQGDYGRGGKNLSWAEREQTVDEVGSIFTVQGFDLNYAGVIIGPSVKYRNGQIIFDADASENPNVKNQRTLVVDGETVKKDVSQGLLKNQLNVLMTRGVRGMGIYAVDDELRKALLKAQKNSEASS
ncbi:DNA/RNA helicase domain-containing protein [Corynebacterium sp. S7]